MRVFRNAWFGRFARKEKISAAALWEAVERAERGLIDADLGGGVIKQRISRPGAGKSSGYRSIVIYRKDDKAFFVFGFPKPDKPEPKRQHKTSVVRKIFGRSADLRPRKCSWVDQEKVCNPLGLKAFCPWRNNRRIHFDTSEFFAGNVKTELVRD